MHGCLKISAGSTYFSTLVYDLTAALKYNERIKYRTHVELQSPSPCRMPQAALMAYGVCCSASQLSKASS